MESGENLPNPSSRQADASVPLNPAPLGAPRNGARVVGILGGLAVAAAVLWFGGKLLFRDAAQNGFAKDDEVVPGVPVPNPFQKWPRKPDLALVFSGQAIGYLQPCGCSSPQYGGLARRFNFLHSLKEKGWNLVALDLGDLSQTQGSQAILKYRAGMKSLEAMRYGAIGLGKNEFLMPLSTALGQHSLDHPIPRVVATNLGNTEPGGLWHKMNVRQSEIIEAGVYKVGVVSIVGPTVAKQIADQIPAGDKKDVTFADPLKALARGLKELKDGKTNFGVLLFHGSEQEANQYIVEAYKLFRAGQAPLLHAAVCLDEFSDPRGNPTQVEGIHTQLITLGHKGKNVGVLGMFRKEKTLEMRYQLVPIGPEFEPKEGNEKINPVLKVMQDYSDELQKENYLSPRYSPRGTHSTQVQHPDAFYVGSDRCKGCHRQAHKVWSGSHHAHAYKTLEDAKFPTGRQFDPECIVCHTVGFQSKTGFADAKVKGAKQIAEHDFKLRDVGCENCHGPASKHVANPNDEKMYPFINQWRPTDAELDPKTPDAAKEGLFKRRMNLIEWKLCQQCHDMENDVNWSVAGFEEKYIARGIIHNMPGGRGDEAMKAAAARKKAAGK